MFGLSSIFLPELAAPDHPAAGLRPSRPQPIQPGGTHAPLPTPFYLRPSDWRGVSLFPRDRDAFSREIARFIVASVDVERRSGPSP